MGRPEVATARSSTMGTVVHFSWTKISAKQLAAMNRVLLHPFHICMAFLCIYAKCISRFHATLLCGYVQHLNVNEAIADQSVSQSPTTSIVQPGYKIIIQSGNKIIIQPGNKIIIQPGNKIVILFQSAKITSNL